MRQKLTWMFALILASSLLLSCGATTNLTGMWADPEFKPDSQKINKILILGMAQREGTRRAFEAEMAKAFEKKKIAAMGSLEAMPFDVELDSLNFPTYFADSGVDGILVSRMVGVDRKVSYSPGYSYAVPHGYYNGFYGYYGATYGVVHSPGYLSTYDVVNVETNLYRLSDKKLIWSGMSETFDFSDSMDAINSFSANVVPELVKKGFFAKQ